MKKYNTSSGEVSGIVIVLVIVVVIIAGVIFGVIKFTANKKTEASKSNTVTQTVEKPKPVYDTTIGNVKFSLVSSDYIGRVIKAKSSYEKDVTTTEQFVRVVIGAQNKGKSNLTQYSWDVGNIVDSEGRNFVSINDQAYSLLPKPDLCGAILKPEFTPTTCVKYYEVSNKSTNLKIVVKVTDPKKQDAVLDLNLGE